MRETHLGGDGGTGARTGGGHEWLPGRAAGGWWVVQVLTEKKRSGIRNMHATGGEQDTFEMGQAAQRDEAVVGGGRCCRGHVLSASKCSRTCWRAGSVDSSPEIYRCTMWSSCSRHRACTSRPSVWVVRSRGPCGLAGAGTSSSSGQLDRQESESESERAAAAERGAAIVGATCPRWAPGGVELGLARWGPAAHMMARAGRESEQHEHRKSEPTTPTHALALPAAPTRSPGAPARRLRWAWPQTSRTGRAVSSGTRRVARNPAGWLRRWRRVGTWVAAAVSPQPSSNRGAQPQGPPTTVPPSRAPRSAGPVSLDVPPAHAPAPRWRCPVHPPPWCHTSVPACAGRPALATACCSALPTG